MFSRWRKRMMSRFIRLWFTDILGMLKSFAISIDELEGALEEGMGFDGSSIEGFARIDESDMVAKPDPDTFQILPWRPLEHNAVARMFCDILKPGGQPFEGDPQVCTEEKSEKSGRFRLYILCRPGTGVLLFQRFQRDRDAGLRRIFRYDHRWMPRPTCGAIRLSPWKKWASASNIHIMKWPPVSMKSTCATRMR